MLKSSWKTANFSSLPNIYNDWAGLKWILLRCQSLQTTSLYSSLVFPYHPRGEGSGGPTPLSNLVFQHPPQPPVLQTLRSQNSTGASHIFIPFYMTDGPTLWKGFPIPPTCQTPLRFNWRLTTPPMSSNPSSRSRASPYLFHSQMRQKPSSELC